MKYLNDHRIVVDIPKEAIPCDSGLSSSHFRSLEAPSPAFLDVDSASINETLSLKDRIDA